MEYYYDQNHAREIAHAIRQYIDHATLPEVGKGRGMVDTIDGYGDIRTAWGRRCAVYKKSHEYMLGLDNGLHNSHQRWMVILGIVLSIELYLGGDDE